VAGDKRRARRFAVALKALGHCQDDGERMRCY
jgi:hypothetical protein